MNGCPTDTPTAPSVEHEGPEGQRPSGSGEEVKVPEVEYPRITPLPRISGRVVQVNTQAQFVVLDFSVNPRPAVGSYLTVQPHCALVHTDGKTAATKLSRLVVVLQGHRNGFANLGIRLDILSPCRCERDEDRRKRKHTQ